MMARRAGMVGMPSGYARVKRSPSWATLFIVGVRAPGP